MNRSIFYWVLLVPFFLGCDSADKGPLPIIGDRIGLDGEKVEHTIRPFEVTSQIGKTITNQDVAGKIHVVDFFFTSCPAICPKVTAQMLRIYNATEDDKNLLLLSHTMDPRRDSIEVLKAYADNLEIDHDKWLFLRGEKGVAIELAVEDYFVAAMEDGDAPGGFDHSGKILLLDKQSKIRAFCDGTDPKSVDGFIKNIERLKKSYE